jgi:DNA sulfur modification protein DndD
MHISQITVRDWKAYNKAVFEFDAPTKNKNITLIGAPNGYGKTSLFEAIILGMFGRRGLPLIASSMFDGRTNDRLTTSYKSFLEKALHNGAINAGRTSCSVKLVFLDDDGETLEIQRIWHFSDTGAYRPQDEEIQIYQGSSRKPIGPGNLRGDEKVEWFLDYITEHLLPFTLAHFFMFDGEQVSVLAEREMTVQVRTGIEGLLGIPLLKKLAQDLRVYAETRRRDNPNVTDEAIEKLENERRELTDKRDKLQAQYEKAEPMRAKLRDQRDSLTRELASYGASSQALLEEQFEQLKKFEQSIESNTEKLEELLMQDLALALSGKTLRQSVKEQLESEEIREGWESGKNQGDRNLDQFINTFDKGVKKINPSLTSKQRELLIENINSAWEKLWYPPPDNCAETYLHPFLTGLERSKVIELLNELEGLGASEVTDILRKISENENSHKHLRDEITRIETVAPDIDKKRDELSKVNGEISKYDHDIGGIERELSALDSQINSKNVELARSTSQVGQALPSTRRAACADGVALMVDQIVEKAVPSQIKAIATAMTKAHRSMSHKKGLVERIDIDEKCEVKLLSGDGIDLREYDLSAGEKQIFTQALISAISSVSECSFPLIIDTPLGRLDVEHRKGVLKHLAQRQHQVVLLSTNTEVVGEYLAELEPHIQRKYLLEFERMGETGQSTVRSGYFNDHEVSA